MHKLHFVNSNTQTGAAQPSPIMPNWNATGISPCIGVIKIKNYDNRKPTSKSRRRSSRRNATDDS